MAFYYKTSVKRVELNTSSICCFSVSFLSITYDNEVTQVMISKLSGIDVMTVSQILSLLEKRGFVERKEHSRDTRAKAVLLNEEGGAILQKAVPLVEEIDEIFFGKLNSDEAQFKHLLGRLHEE